MSETDKPMGELEFAALLVSRVCHDLVSPVGAVVNGLEVLEDERDATMRADALKLVTSSAEQATARLQFARIAFGAAGSAGAELDLNEVGRTVQGLVRGGKVKVDWQAGQPQLAEGLGEAADERDIARLRQPAARRTHHGRNIVGSRSAGIHGARHRTERPHSRRSGERPHAASPSIRSTAAASRPS
jgi:hypothetical protein